MMFQSTGHNGINDKSIVNENADTENNLVTAFDEHYLISRLEDKYHVNNTADLKYPYNNDITDYSIIDDFIVAVRSSKRYENTFDQIISDRDFTDEKDLAKTTLYIPQTLIIAIKLLETKYKKSETRVIRSLIEHGFSILQHKHLVTIGQIDRYYVRLVVSKHMLIRNYLTGFRNDVGDKTKCESRNVRLRIGYKSWMKKLSDKLHIQDSSIMRICICYSLSNGFDNLGDNSFETELHQYIGQQIGEFEEMLVSSITFFHGFETAQREYYELKGI